MYMRYQDHMDICYFISPHDALSLLFVVQSLSPVQFFETDPVDWSTPGFPVLYFLLEFSQTHVY